MMLCYSILLYNIMPYYSILHYIKLYLTLRESGVKVAWIAASSAASLGRRAEYSHLQTSESSFAICFLLKIPMRGFPFQVKSFENCRIPKNSTQQSFPRISFEKEIPLRGSQAGNISQTS